MLAARHRIRTTTDFRQVMTRGVRFRQGNLLMYMSVNQVSGTNRFGFIVTKAVGKAVVRNQLKRRLRAIARDYCDEAGKDVVVRVLSLRNESFHELHTAFAQGWQRCEQKIIVLDQGK